MATGAVLGLAASSAEAQAPPCELQKLTAADATAFDQFGRCVSVSGDTVVVGARLDDCAAGFDCGAAYIFCFAGSAWVEEAKLTASDAAAFDHFGFSVSVSGNTAVVGAPFDDCAAGGNCGAAYVFRFNGSDWAQEAKLTAADAADGDSFGSSVSVSGDTAVVGADGKDCVAGSNCGAAYVYRFDGSAWFQEARLAAADAAAGDFFGRSVSLSGNTAVVGAWADDRAGCSGCGAAYVFRASGSAWFQEAKLTAADAAAQDFFGFSVSLSGDTAVVGAWNVDCAAGSTCGAAYVYRFDGGAWVQEAKLTAADAAAGDEFGGSVTLSGNAAVVGAPLDDWAGAPFSNRGAAYVYRFNGTTWVQEAKLIASDAAATDVFGWSVSLSGNAAVVGARLADCAAGSDCGAAYMFAAGPDCNVNGVPDGCDIRDRTSQDLNGNGVPDECEPGVTLDIRPAGCPNPLNVKSRGVVPMAVVGSESFDEMEIDIESLALSRTDGVGGLVVPLTGPPGPGANVEDMATPFAGELCDCQELQGDGIDDLVLKFSTRELVEVLELDSLQRSMVVTLTVSGSLLDGTAFEASDCMTIVSEAAPPRPDKLDRATGLRPILKPR